MGRSFKSFLNLRQNWLEFKKILEKFGNLAQNLAQNWADDECVTFPWKIGVCMGFPSNSVGASLPKPNLSTPPCV